MNISPPFRGFSGIIGRAFPKVNASDAKKTRRKQTQRLEHLLFEIPQFHHSSILNIDPIDPAVFTMHILHHFPEGVPVFLIQTCLPGGDVDLPVPVILRQP